MEQVTHPTDHATPSGGTAADLEREGYRRASAVMDAIVDKMETLPRSAAVVGDLIGFRVVLNFGTNDPLSVREFAAIAGATAVVTQETASAWLEAKAIVDDIEVCAQVLLSVEASAAFEASVPAEPADDVATVPMPVPLGEVASALASTCTVK